MTSESFPVYIRTHRLFHVFAARRSGQHAIIGWLQSLMRSNHDRINNCSLPYNFKASSHKRLSSSSIPARALILNYEDKYPRELKRLHDEGKSIVTGIEGAETTYVMILRDPFNNLASKRKANPERDLEYAHRELELWKSHAREYLGETCYLPSVIPINFNSWFADAAYRARLSIELKTDFPADIPAASAALQSVPVTGKSQFDGRRFLGQAQSMDVLHRWKLLRDDPIYLEAIRDRELVELSARIFNLDGIREVLNCTNLTTTRFGETN